MARRGADFAFAGVIAHTGQFGPIMRAHASSFTFTVSISGRNTAVMVIISLMPASVASGMESLQNGAGT